MKKFFVFLAISIAAIFAFSDNASAQTNKSPKDFIFYNSWPWPSGARGDSAYVKYYVNRKDTLYDRHWYRGTATFLKIGGLSRSSITLDVSDTMSVGIVAKSRTRASATAAASAWATILTDSIQNTGAASSSGLVKEFSLVDTDSDLFDAVDTEIMVILTSNAWTSDTQGTAYIRARLNWVP